jgi:hypothetical protein
MPMDVAAAGGLISPLFPRQIQALTAQARVMTAPLDQLPEFLQTLMGWSDAYWYAAVRVLMNVGGLLLAFGLLFNLVLKDLPTLLKQPLAFAAAALGPFGPMFLAQIFNLSNCQMGAIMIGRAITGDICDLAAAATPAMPTLTTTEAAEAFPSWFIALQNHWLFIAISWLIFLIVAASLLRELYGWAAAKLDNSKEM